jgi:uncharacterized membrane protein HdeD (DUF308 family)
MRTLNLAVSILLVISGLFFTLFMLTQASGWNIGVAIGVVLLLNGIVRIVFALGDEGDGDDTQREP